MGNPLTSAQKKPAGALIASSVISVFAVKKVMSSFFCTEQWRPVVGHEGWYEVSSCGRIRRIRSASGTSSGFILRDRRAGGRSNKQYVQVVLCEARELTYCWVHRLVAEAFIGPPPTSRHETNHRDSNSLNNHANNLEWMTRAENIEHARAAGRLHPPVFQGTEHGGAKLSDDQVREIRRLRGVMTQSRLAVRYGVSRQLISQIQLRQGWRHLQ